MFVHEYSETQFKTYEECREDLIVCIEEEDVVERLDLTVEEIVSQFNRRANNQNFINWFEEKIFEAEQMAIDDLITEYDEGEAE